METKFNSIQKELINLAREKGFLTIDDVKKFYTSPITIKANIERFILLEIIKETNTLGKFELVK